MTDQIPLIDYNSIDVPSHSITVGHLLGRPRPGNDEFSFEEDGHRLDAMIFLERQFGEIAYLNALGKHEEANNVAESLVLDGPSLDFYRDELAGLYTRFGVADGPESAKQLIRKLESSATSQARSHLGPSPS